MVDLCENLVQKVHFTFKTSGPAGQACVSQKTRKLLGPENGPVKPPKQLSGVSQSAREVRTRENHVIFSRKLYGYSPPPEKFFSGFFFRNKMAAVGALLGQTRQPRQYMTRTSIANMRENDIIERYRLSPGRIRWLVTLLEDKLERDTGRNFPLSAETQVS